MARFFACIGVGCLIALFVVFSIKNKEKHDKLKSEIDGLALKVQTMDQDTATLVKEIQSKWVARHTSVDGPHVMAIQGVGLDQSVEGWIEILSRPMPEYGWLSPLRNKNAAIFGTLQALTIPMSADRTVYVSPDRHTALVHCHEGAAMLYSDEGSGIRETLYVAPKDLVETK